MADGRYAPSPTASLHLGNLRTALVAWLLARDAGSRFLLRVEDLDEMACRREHEISAIADLAALGIDHDGEVMRQSERHELYRSALDRLIADDLAYPCFCTRREVLAEAAEASAAPNGPVLVGAYAGTCRDLGSAARAEREAAGRRPSLRLRTDGTERTFVDRVHGAFTGPVDDFVIRRADGLPAYNLAVVVDDAEMDVDEVVRGDDLLPTTPRQIVLQELLGLPTPSYAHVPLVIGSDGERLAKRHGAVSLEELRAARHSDAEVLRVLAASIGCDGVDGVASAADVLDRFSLDRLPLTTWTVPDDLIAQG